MEAIKSMISGYKNNLIGTAAGIGAGYLVAKKLGYHDKLTLIPFLVVGSIIGSQTQHYLRARKGMPTASIVKS